MSIAKTALLISLSIGMPPQSKKIAKKSEQIEIEEGTAKRQASVIAKLYAKEDITGLQQACTAARQMFKERTLPWGRGMGLLPVSQYMSFMEDIRKCKAAFEMESKSIIDNIDEILHNAQIVNGGLFDQANYLSRQELEESMYFTIEATTVPTENNFDQLAGLSEEEVSSLKAEAVAGANARTEGAVKELFARLFTSLQHAADRLTKEDDGSYRVFRDSLISNIEKAVIAAETLNVTGNEQINELVIEAKAMIEGLTPSELRKDEGLREQTRAAAESLSKRIGEFL